MPTGVVDSETATALGLADLAPAGEASDDITVTVTSQNVVRMFPAATPIGNIKGYLPAVLRALHEKGLGDKLMVIMALATIRAETAGFEPISEFKSKFNTSPNGHPFDLYDNRTDLGNRGRPDGASFKGRGFVQLTGRANYSRFDGVLGLNGKLVTDPELANDADIAADLLACFLKNKETAIREALRRNDLARARWKVNGGSHGLEQFSAAFRTGMRVL